MDDQARQFGSDLRLIFVLLMLMGCSNESSGIPQQGDAVTKPPVAHVDLEAVTPPDLDTVTEPDVWVPLRDGTRLVADITLPISAGPWPTILIRTPYGRDLESPGDYAKRGYAYVVQATRGRDGSEGVWGAWEDDKNDGYDTIDWIVAQDWSDGKVGMSGGSYLGQAQILAAASGHPALKCIVPLSPGSDGFSDYPFRAVCRCSVWCPTFMQCADRNMTARAGVRGLPPTAICWFCR